MFEAVCYNHIIHGDSLREIKRKASRIANTYFNSLDCFFVVIDGCLHTFTRINNLCPNNTIRRGEWR